MDGPCTRDYNGTLERWTETHHTTEKDEKV